MDLDAQMDAFMKQAEQLVPNTRQKAEMTKAGAAVLENKLKQATKTKHYQPNRVTTHVKHLADSITSEPQSDGNTIVGYETKDESGINHARIARLLNDGWKSHPGDHFHNEARKAAEPAVFEAEHKVYERIKGGESK